MAIVIRVLTSGEVQISATDSYVTDAGGGNFRALERVVPILEGEPGYGDLESRVEEADLRFPVVVGAEELPAIVRGMVKNGKVHRPQGGVQPEPASAGDEGEDAEAEIAEEAAA